jgi:hypothetical protein
MYEYFALISDFLISLLSSEIFIAIVTALFTAGGTVFLQNYRERRKLLNALKGEIISNSRRSSKIVEDLIAEADSRNQLRTTNYIGEVTRLKKTSYENIVSEGVVTSLSSELQDDIFEHYERVEKVNRLIEMRKNLDSDLDLISSAFAIILQISLLMSDDEIIDVIDSIANFNMSQRNSHTQEEMISSLEDYLDSDYRLASFNDLETKLDGEINFLN